MYLELVQSTEKISCGLLQTPCINHCTIIINSFHAKYDDEGAEIDVDTLPDMKNARSFGKCIEVMALSKIVH